VNFPLKTKKSSWN